MSKSRSGTPARGTTPSHTISSQNDTQLVSGVKSKPTSSSSRASSGPSLHSIHEASLPPTEVANDAPIESLHFVRSSPRQRKSPSKSPEKSPGKARQISTAKETKVPSKEIAKNVSDKVKTGRVGKKPHKTGNQPLCAVNAVVDPANIIPTKTPTITDKNNKQVSVRRSGRTRVTTNTANRVNDGVIAKARVASKSRNGTGAQTKGPAKTAKKAATAKNTGVSKETKKPTAKAKPKPKAKANGAGKK